MHCCHLKISFHFLLKFIKIKFVPLWKNLGLSACWPFLRNCSGNGGGCSGRPRLRCSARTSRSCSAIRRSRSAFRNNLQRAGGHKNRGRPVKGKRFSPDQGRLLGRRRHQVADVLIATHLSRFENFQQQSLFESTLSTITKNATYGWRLF